MSDSDLWRQRFDDHPALGALDHWDEPAYRAERVADQMVAASKESAATFEERLDALATFRREPLTRIGRRDLGFGLWLPGGVTGGRFNDGERFKEQL